VDINKTKENSSNLKTPIVSTIKKTKITENIFSTFGKNKSYFSDSGSKFINKNSTNKNFTKKNENLIQNLFNPNNNMNFKSKEKELNHSID